jgi:hypothetical protein
MKKSPAALIAIAAVAALAFTGCSAQGGSPKAAGDEKPSFSDVSIIVPADTNYDDLQAVREDNVDQTQPVTVDRKSVG